MLWIKYTGTVKTKRKDFIDAVPIISSKLIVDDGLEDLWRRDNSDSHDFICYNRSFAKDQYRQCLYWWYHIMVSFTNYYNAISSYRLPSKTKIGKYSWYCKSEVSSTTKTFLFLLKYKKASTAAVDLSI